MLDLTCSQLVVHAPFVTIALHAPYPNLAYFGLRLNKGDTRRCGATPFRTDAPLIVRPRIPFSGRSSGECVSDRASQQSCLEDTLRIRSQGSEPARWEASEVWA